MMAWLFRESRVGSLHGGKELTNVSKVPQAPAGLELPVDYIDPVARHIWTTSAYGVSNQLVKDLNLPSSNGMSKSTHQSPPKRQQPGFGPLGFAPPRVAIPRLV